LGFELQTNSLSGHGKESFLEIVERVDASYDKWICAANFRFANAGA